MGAKCALVAVYDILSAAFLAALVLACLPMPAFAYVDPSVMTYTIQALAGVAVALGAVAGVALRRTRKALLKALNIDENANKTVELDVSRCQPGQAPQEPRYRKRGRMGEDAFGEAGEPAAVAAAAGATPAAGTPTPGAATPTPGTPTPRRRTHAPLPWRRRLALAAIVTFFAAFTLCIVAPLEIVAGNTASLIFGVGDVWLIMAAVTLAGTVAASLLISALRGVAYQVAVAVVFAFGLCCWVQALFLNAGLPAADGTAVAWWGDHAASMVVSLVAWLAIIAVAVAFACRRRQVARRVFGALAVVLVIVQGAGLASAVLGAQSSSKDGALVATEAGMYEVCANGQNVIVFVLDAFDTQIMQRLATDSPESLAGFDGFTWYTDSTSMSMGTEFCLPYLLTDTVPQDGQTGDEYREGRYANGTFLRELADTGYSVGVYSDFIGLEYVRDQDMARIFGETTCNFKGVGDVQVSTTGTVLALMKCALYRDMPWVAKERCRFYTDYVNRRVVVSNLDQSPQDTLYTTNDAKYLLRLQNFGLTATQGTGAFRLIHLMGAHAPWTTDAQGREVAESETDETQAAKGALSIVRTYMDYLRELGLYEDATIIVTADHGQWGYYPHSPLVMVKAAGKASGFAASSAPVSQDEFHATVLSAMGSQAASGHGRRYQDVAEGEQRARVMYEPYFEGKAQYLERCDIAGNVLDEQNWEHTGKRWYFAH